MKDKLKEAIISSIPENRDIIHIIPKGKWVLDIRDYIEICIELGLEYKIKEEKGYIMFTILNDINYKRIKKIEKLRNERN